MTTKEMTFAKPMLYEIVIVKVEHDYKRRGDDHNVYGIVVRETSQHLFVIQIEETEIKAFTSAGAEAQIRFLAEQAEEQWKMRRTDGTVVNGPTIAKEGYSYRLLGTKEEVELRYFESDHCSLTYDIERLANETSAYCQDLANELARKIDDLAKLRRELLDDLFEGEDEVSELRLSGLSRDLQTFQNNFLDEILRAQARLNSVIPEAAKIELKIRQFEMKYDGRYERLHFTRENWNAPREWKNASAPVEMSPSAKAYDDDCRKQVINLIEDGTTERALSRVRGDFVHKRAAIEPRDMK